MDLNPSFHMLFEHDVKHDLQALDRAWESPATFAFVADKSGTPGSWIADRLATLPSKYTEDHFVLLTSGSTGRPKLVVGRRDRADRLAAALHDAQESEPVRETVCVLPLTYCYAFVNQWCWARIHRRRFVMTSGLAQPDRLQQALAAAADAMICLVGAQAPLLTEYFEGYTFPGVVRVHFAGGRFPQERLDAVRMLFPQAAIFNNYGCTEAMPRLTLRRAEASPHAHCIGRPLPGVELRSDASERILFRSRFGAVAWLDDSGLMEVDETTWVPSGDLGRLGADGQWELIGREGEVFKRYGEKVSPMQILASVRAMWRGQADFYIATDPRDEAGYVLLLSPHPTEDEVRTLLRNVSLKHPRTHWPLRVESLETLPLSPNGKIDRQSLAGNIAIISHWKQII